MGNTGYSVDPSWSGIRLKRELRLRGSVPQWHWCKVHHVAGNGVIEDAKTLLECRVTSGTILRASSHSLPQSIEGVLAVLNGMPVSDAIQQFGARGARSPSPSSPLSPHDAEQARAGAAYEIGSDPSKRE